MRRAISLWENESYERLAEDWNTINLTGMSIVFEYRAGFDQPTLVLSPYSLRSAMWIQFAQAVSGNAQLAQCAVCPAWFVYGTGTGRRRTSMYCSNINRIVSAEIVKSATLSDSDFNFCTSLSY